MARLLRNRHDTNAEPRLTRRMFELGMLAILMHDTGYLKKQGDTEGTGAKYTLTHVDRSIQFAGELMLGHDYPVEDILAVQNMIRCTGVNVKLDSIQFQDDLERIAGFALGTSDLLGQMAAADYVDKLPILYSEFAEAARYNERQNEGRRFLHQRRGPDAKDPAVLGKLCPAKKSTAISSASIASSVSRIPTARIPTSSASKPTSPGCAANWPPPASRPDPPRPVACRPI